MSPAPSETAVAEGDENADGEHQRVALRLSGGDLNECTDAGIGSLDKVAVRG